MTVSDYLQPPALALSLSELPRSGMEATRLLLGLRKLIKVAPAGAGQAVLALPGYGGGDGSMAVLRYFLKRIGYKAYGLDLGRNLESADERIMRVEDASRFREKMVALVIERIKEIYRSSGQPVALVGWSMGGLYAFDASQELPEMTRMVVTLGSPYGDPRATSTFKLLRWLNGSDVPVEEQDFDGWLNKRRLKTDKVPIKVLYSQKDGIVAAGIATLGSNACIEHIEVDSSHVGFAVNLNAYYTVASLLSNQVVAGGNLQSHKKP